MPSPTFVNQLNTQIGNEFAAHQQYVAIAAYFDGLTMPQLAAFFYRQALEERNHAMMMAQYLIDTDESVVIPAVPAPVCKFGDVVEPLELGLAQELRVTEQIFALMAIARQEHDFASEQFIQWFVKEQVEETATIKDLLAVIRRAPSNVEAIEDYVLREQGSAGDSTGAPRIAGA
jgi:ferritin